MVLNQNDIDNINNILINEIKPNVIYLFGSSAKGISRPDSDLDLAFLSEKELSDYNVFMIAQEIASKLNIDVDLVDLNKASTVFKAQIVGTGKVIYCNDDVKRMYFEMYAFKDYALLNEEREIILRDIRERGSVYGK